MTKRPTTRQVRALLGATALAVMAAAVGSSRSAAPAPPTGTRFAALLPEAPECSVEGRSGTARARAAEREALAQSERYPFAPEAGVRAWALFSEAAACHRAAGDEAAALRALRRASTWLHRLERDAHAGRLRLERALQFKDAALASVEASQLLRLLPPGDDDYRRWLLHVREVDRGAPP